MATTTKKRPAARAPRTSVQTPLALAQTVSAAPRTAAPTPKLSRAPDGKLAPLAPFLGALADLFADDEIWIRAQQFGVVERKRKLDPAILVEATVLSLCGPQGMQTSASVLYESLGGVGVARSSFYDWYDAEFSLLLKWVAQRAITAVKTVEAERPDGPDEARVDDLLERIGDVRMVDSSSQLLSRIAQNWAPSASTKKRPAGVKLHAVVTLDSPIVDTYTVTAQSVHDNRQLRADMFEPGTLALYDLGYVDHARELEMFERGVRLLRRLKSNEQPRITRVVTGAMDGHELQAVGKVIDEALAYDIHFDRLVELEVVVGKKGRTWPARVIGAPTPEGKMQWYLTTLSAECLPAEDVPAAYSMRWEVELVFKAMKSGLGMNRIEARCPDSVTALLHAKVIALALARLLYLAAEKRAGRNAVNQLAIVLSLTRLIPWIIAIRSRDAHYDLLSEEHRIVDTAIRHSRSRNKRRDAEKRKRAAKLGVK